MNTADIAYSEQAFDEYRGYGIFREEDGWSIVKGHFNESIYHLGDCYDRIDELEA